MPVMFTPKSTTCTDPSFSQRDLPGTLGHMIVGGATRGRSTPFGPATSATGFHVASSSRAQSNSSPRYTLLRVMRELRQRHFSGSFAPATSTLKQGRPCASSFRKQWCPQKRSGGRL